jgi:predicted  nucleic acid-binding Zn-ribbon protein
MTRTLREIHALGLGMGLLLSGCASAPPPVGLLDDAGAAVEAARGAKADEYAAVELGQAEEQLAAARLAMDERDYAQARDLAEQAGLNAELAAARSRAAAGREKVRAGTDENARLRRELHGGRQ